MTLARRHLCLAILIASLVGHFGIAVHAATHVSGDSGDCELCISYGNSTHTIPAEHEQDFGVAPFSYALADPKAAPTERPDTPYQPRGPPLVN